MKNASMVSIFFTMITVLLAYGESPIIVVGENYLTESGLASFQISQDEDPMIAVDKIKRMKGLEKLAKKHNFTGTNTENSLYNKFFGVSLIDDKTKATALDLPIAIREPASQRMNIYEEYLTRFSDEAVPVKFLDPQAFWKLVQKTRSYQIRKDAGIEPRFQSWQYARGELMVDPSISVAKADGKEFVTGKDLNAYINSNYDGFRQSATRGEKLEQIRSQLAMDMVKGKLLEKMLAAGEFAIDSNDIDRATDRFVRKSMFKGDMDLRKIATMAGMDLNVELHKKAAKDNQTAVNNLIKILKGGKDQEPSNSDEELTIIEAANDAMLKSINASVTDYQAYDWMKSNSFQGALHEAKQAIAFENQEKILVKKIADLKITISSLTE